MANILDEACAIAELSEILCSGDDELLYQWIEEYNGVINIQEIWARIPVDPIEQQQQQPVEDMEGVMEYNAEDLLDLAGLGLDMGIRGKEGVAEENAAVADGVFAEMLQDREIWEHEVWDEVREEWERDSGYGSETNVGE